MSRVLDVFVAFTGLLVLSPVLAILALAVFLADLKSPLFLGVRVGQAGRRFHMVKFRSMRSSSGGAQSTAASDPRITRVGSLLRRFKLDELPQLWNVLVGEMSLVGPRPQVESEVKLYTEAECRMLSVRPGITDIASIVFADESDILNGQTDPDDAYRKWIRPWKSRLALTALDHAGFGLTVRTLAWTVQNGLNRRRTLDRIENWLHAQRVPEVVARMAARREALIDWPPPQSRDRMEEVLSRPSRITNRAPGSSHLAGRTVVVTGAAGSIGTELCVQAARLGARAVVAIDHAETPLFHLERKMRAEHPGTSFFPEVANVQVRRRLDDIFLRFHPDTVYHAAAYKHVPLMERHLIEAVENNILGAWNVARAAAEFEVEEFVLISSDKAVQPVSVMGMTKKVAERVCLAAGDFSGRGRYLAVRFGNVFGSAGSVVPLFEEQIAAGGPVTVTHSDMERYFMSIPEAVELVIEAGALAHGGEVFCLDMGPPIRIVDLARSMVRESGKPIEIVYSGVRPGEKLAESLWEQDERAFDTTHSRIRGAQLDVLSGHETQRVVNILTRLVEARNEEGLRGYLMEKLCAATPAVTPEFTQFSFAKARAAEGW